MQLFTTTAQTGEIVMVGANGVLIDQGSQALRVGTSAITAITNGIDRIKIAPSLPIYTYGETRLGSSGSIDSSMELMNIWERRGTAGVQNACSFGLTVGAKDANIASAAKVNFALNSGAAQSNAWGSVPDVNVMTLLGNGNVGIGITNPSSNLHVAGRRVDIGGPDLSLPVFNGLYEDAWRSQLVLTSNYSDLVIASESKNDYHGSTLTFATRNPDDRTQYKKWALNQGNWGAAADKLSFSYGWDSPNPHSFIAPHNGQYGTVMTIDGSNCRLGIGTSGPKAPLQVTGGGGTGNFTQSLGSGANSNAMFGQADYGLTMMTDGNGITHFQGQRFGLDASAYGYNDVFPITLNAQGGNVGIGTKYPDGNLHVASGLGYWSVITMGIPNTANQSPWSLIRSPNSNISLGNDQTGQYVSGVHMYLKSGDLTHNSWNGYNIGGVVRIAAGMIKSKGNYGNAIGGYDLGGDIFIDSGACARRIDAGPGPYARGGNILFRTGKLINLQSEAAVENQGEDFNNRMVIQSNSPIVTYGLTNLGSSGSQDASMELMNIWQRNGTAGVQNACSFGLIVGAQTANLSSAATVHFALNSGAADSNGYGAIPDRNVMTLGGNGAVGIGITNPVANLQVNGGADCQVRLSSSNVNGTSDLVFDNSLSAYWHNNGYDNNASTTKRGSTYGAALIRCSSEDSDSYENSSLTFWTCYDPKPDGIGGTGNLSQRMVIRSSGSVGIGTTNPNAPLQVTGGGGGGNITQSLGSGANSTAIFGQANYGLTMMTDGYGITHFQGQRYGLDASASGYNDVFPITLNAQGGSVGIGTMYPTSKLHLYGNGAGDGDARLFIQNNSDATTAYSILQMYNNSGAGLSMFLNSSERAGDGGKNATTIRNDVGHLLLQSKGGSGIKIEANSGYVGIGEVNLPEIIPRYRLHVGPGPSITGAGPCSYFTPGGGLATGNNGFFGVSIYAENCIVAKDAIVASVMTAYSDIRIKKNIQPKNGLLKLIDQVNLYSYDHIDKNKSHVEVGIIAQEIREILPACVIPTKEYLPNVYNIASSHEQLEDRVRVYVTNSLNAGDNVKIYIKRDTEKTHISSVIAASDDFIDVSVWDDYSELDKAFVYGSEDSEVLTVDKVQLGIAALGGVKELSAIVREKERVIEDQQRVIEDLSARLSRVEQLLSKLIA
jgi:hypothetical protein